MLPLFPLKVRRVIVRRLLAGRIGLFFRSLIRFAPDRVPQFADVHPDSLDTSGDLFSLRVDVGPAAVKLGRLAVRLTIDPVHRTVI